MCAVAGDGKSTGTQAGRMVVGTGWNPLRAWLCLLGLVCLACVRGRLEAAGDWFARAWQTDEGLPDNVVVGVVQGTDGFLWVATQGGLVRFDGRRFQGYEPVTEAGGPSGLLHGLGMDRRGRLWITKDSGVLVGLDADGITSVIRLPEARNARQVPVLEDAGGDLWLAYPTVAGRVFRIRDGAVTVLTEADGIPADGRAQVGLDSKGGVWIAVGDWIGRMNKGRVETVGRVAGLDSLVAAGGGGVWACAGRLVYRIRPDGTVVAEGVLPAEGNDPGANVMLEDGRGRLWVGTGQQGLFVGQDGVFEPVPVSHREILSLSCDSEGNVWVGTRGGGLNRVRERVVASREIASGLPFEAVRSVCCEPDGTLWAVARSGVVARRRGEVWTALGGADGWTVPDAMSVVPAAGGGVWIGTHHDGVFRWKEGVQDRVGTEAGLAGNFARSLLVTPEGDLWIGTASADGLHRLRSGVVERFALPVGSGLVRALALGPDGTIWAGTAAGMLLRVEGDRVVEETAARVPRVRTIRCLHATADGTLWVGYGGGGVGRLRGEEYHRFGSEAGMVDDYVSQVMEDGLGHLWFAGNKGLFRVGLGQFDAVARGGEARLWPTAFGREDGLPALQASREAWPGMVRADDGRLWIAMQTGLAEVTPGRSGAGPVPSVTLESVWVDGLPVAVQGPAGLRVSDPVVEAGLVRLERGRVAMVRVPAGHEQVSIEFTAPVFGSPQNVGLRFRLEGLETGWVEAGARRVAYYSHLPPGRYRFRVEVRGASGWVGNVPELDFEVAPWLWQVGWFQGLVGLLVVGGVAGMVRTGVRRRMRREVEMAERRSMLERERARIAKDIHDDLGSSLTEILLLSELGQDGVGTREEIRGDLARIAERTRHLTRALDATVWAVNPRNDTLASLVGYVCSHAEGYLGAAGVRCRMEVADEIPPVALGANVRHNVFLIVKEVLHNVVKHSGATEVALRIEVAGPELRLVIEDDGRGMRRGGEMGAGGERVSGCRGGNGLENMRRRAEECGAWLEIGSGAMGGVRVGLGLKVGAGG